MIRRLPLALLSCALPIVASAGATSAAEKPARYVLHQLTVPPGDLLDGDFMQGAVSVDGVARRGPRTIALAANGAVAAIVTNTGNLYPARTIVVWRPGGSRVTIGLPDPAVLDQGFHHRGGRVDTFPSASFSRVVLADDGTPFATVTNSFSGAYSGIDKAVFRWIGTKWRNVPPAGEPISPARSDYDVVAAELPKLRIGLTGDSSSADVSFDELEHTPGYQLPEAMVYDGLTMRGLGAGTMTALAGAYACGFIGEQNGRTMPDNVNVEGQIPYALLWHDGATTRLGRGLAFGVNAGGVAVGDNRVSIEGGPLLATRAEYDRLKIMPGKPPVVVPVRWDAHGATVLGREPGTAFAIARNGTTVGALVHGGGFVSRGSSLTALDALVSGSHVHIRGAYSIDPRGRILVLTGLAGTPGLAYLDPVP
ncbi:MAG TPA: hypothetical protein VGU66_01860 [Candidatus Elarobacter sp.]|nr:hypothetical protein [Candidatus Elarobacter sp.]